eukprot:CAMPEP_0113600194 /NCGR_PEP_ID=MMETSP0015_2-20120614/42576_1 /TAXON_ID=2838 /ORGANISM="Odontella" /LENGTH=725 /DNA_ID=CAMNT_0000508433 /DNA_START=379 /DNA_END=2553 /DNA_ORIENTATION=+ /assembly_acc=CAM_ASM_000160
MPRQKIPPYSYQDADATVVSFGGSGADASRENDRNLAGAPSPAENEAAAQTPPEWWRHSDASVQFPETSEGSVGATEADIARESSGGGGGDRKRIENMYEAEAFDVPSYSDSLRSFLGYAAVVALDELDDSSTTRALEALSVLREDAAAGERGEDDEREDEEAELSFSLSWGRSRVNVGGNGGGGNVDAKDTSFYDDDDDDDDDYDDHHSSYDRSPKDDGLEVTAVEWGASGSLLAASFGARSPGEGNGWRRSSGAGGAVVVWDVHSGDFRRGQGGNGNGNGNGKYGDPSSSSSSSSSPEPMGVHEHGSHIVCLAAHPSRPAVLAAGSSDGEVLLLDFARSPSPPPPPREGTQQSKSSSLPSSPLVASSKIGEYYHREPVEAVTWIAKRKTKREGKPKEDGEDWLLCSVSGDGKALLWDVGSKLKYPLRGMRLGRRPRSGQYNEHVSSISSSRAGSVSVLGGTAVSVPPSKFGHDGIFFGTEGGALLRASLQDDVQDKKPAKINGAKMKWSTNALHLISKVPSTKREGMAKEIESKAKLLKRRGIDSAAVLEGRPSSALLYPVQTDFEYSGHDGTVTSVDVSPFRRNLFLSCGSDGRLCFFSSLHREPVAALEPSMSPYDLKSSPILDAKFSRSKPTVIAAGSADGSIYIYELESSSEQPRDVLQPERQSNYGMTSVAFNEKFPSLLAAGDAGGVVAIFRLPKRLTRRVRRDDDVLARFSDMGGM